jgi:hypothetical protein
MMTTFTSSAMRRAKTAGASILFAVPEQEGAGGDGFLPVHFDDALISPSGNNLQAGPGVNTR